MADVISGLWEIFSDHIEPAQENILSGDVKEKIAKNFREAMRSTNPTLTFALSNNGPLSRFVAAVIPLVTGERPTEAAVRAELMRRRARYNRNG